MDVNGQCPQKGNGIAVFKAVPSGPQAGGEKLADRLLQFMGDLSVLEFWWGVSVSWRGLLLDDRPEDILP